MKCKTSSCENQSTPRTNYCKNCNAGMSNWSHRRPAEVLERRRRLTMYNARVELVISRRGIKS